MKYRIMKASLIVTKPNGELSQLDSVAFYDTTLDTFGFLVTEDSAIQGYSVEISQKFLKLVRDVGAPIEELPKVTVNR